MLERDVQHAPLPCTACATHTSPLFIWFKMQTYWVFSADPAHFRPIPRLALQVLDSCWWKRTHARTHACLLRRPTVPAVSDSMRQGTVVMNGRNKKICFCTAVEDGTKGFVLQWKTVQKGLYCSGSRYKILTDMPDSWLICQTTLICQIPG